MTSILTHVLGSCMGASNGLASCVWVGWSRFCILHSCFSSCLGFLGIIVFGFVGVIGLGDTGI